MHALSILLGTMAVFCLLYAVLVVGSLVCARRPACSLRTYVHLNLPSPPLILFYLIFYLGVANRLLGGDRGGSAVSQILIVLTVLDTGQC